MQRRDECIVEPHDECDSASRNSGNAVCKRHAESSGHCFCMLSNFSHNESLPDLYPAHPQMKPSMHPASTSVGKCTYRYSRENAMMTANTMRYGHSLSPQNKRHDAAANAAVVCPDGNE